jgi:predicted Fe-Mo cluster-binding NifX family protein
MKVAFATRDLVHVDEQFRRASSLAVYESDADGHRLVVVHRFAPDRSVKTAERMKAIEGVALVYGVAFLPSTVARLARTGIRAATAPAGAAIEALLAELDREGRSP